MLCRERIVGVRSILPMPRDQGLVRLVTNGIVGLGLNLFLALVLLHMLNLIEKFPMTARTPLNVHRAVEVLKFGFAAR